MCEANTKHGPFSRCCIPIGSEFRLQKVTIIALSLDRYVTANIFKIATFNESPCSTVSYNHFSAAFASRHNWKIRVFESRV